MTSKIDDHILFIVTGGANGIGSTLTQYILDQPKTMVAVLDIDSQKLESDIKRYTSMSHRFLAVECNTCSITSLTNAKEAVIDYFGKINLQKVVLISLAGRALSDEFEPDILPDPAVVEASVHLNLLSHYNSIYVFSEVLTKGTQFGAVILGSSINSIVCADLLGYSAAKSGLRGLAVALSRLLFQKYRTTINVAMIGTVQPSDPKRLENKSLSKLAGSTFSGNIMTELDASHALFWLAMAPRNVTGREVVIDLGQSLNLIRHVGEI